MIRLIHMNSSTLSLWISVAFTLYMHTVIHTLPERRSALRCSIHAFFAVAIGLEEIETFVAVIVVSIQAVHGCFGCLCAWVGKL